MMEIKEVDGNFLVVLNGETLYTALTEGEAQGYIEWKQRPDAGNLPGDCGGCDE